MTTTPRSGARSRSLQDDLLDDLRQGPAHAGAAPVTPEAAPKAPAFAAAPTYAVELRITPRSWSSARWERPSEGDRITINVGPLRLSLGRLGP